MKRKSTKVLFTITMLLAAICFPKFSYAQIVYNNKGLNIGGAPEHPYLGVTVNNYLGMYWTCKGYNFFQLDISPANPRIAGTGDEVVFFNSATSTFNSIQVANVYNYSDARAKTNIKNINSGLNTILQLRPVSYNWKESNSDVTKDGIQAKATTRIGENIAYGPEEQQLQYGFLAQEVEKIIPDAVKTDEEGHKMINYTVLIPLLVQSVQDLTSQIEEQKSLIAELSMNENTTDISSLTKKAKINRILNYTPNPTKGMMTFTFNVEENKSDVFLVICNLSGVQEKRIEVPYNQSSVQVDLSPLNSGLHIASLVVSGKVCDSKQIIKN